MPLPGYTVKYYLKLASQDDTTWKQVSEAEFCVAERAAGFHPKGGKGPATGGFYNSGGVQGKVEYVKDPETAE